MWYVRTLLNMTRRIPHVRYAAVWVAWFVARIGYMIRPYDMLADRRRWFSRGAESNYPPSPPKEPSRERLA